jgi:hypothetical protein
MRPWNQDFSGCGLEDILRFQAANREWSKQLRVSISALVNRRLAKSLSQDEYLAGRKLLKEDAAECQSRAAVLEAQVARRRS